MNAFGTQKPAAALSSGLLARKGQARPAMRPQGFVGLAPASALDDLGWNDMGHDAASPTPPLPAPAPQPLPPVLRDRDALSAGIAATPAPAPAEPRPVSPATAARIDREVRAHRSKAAFTLRLDADRHLRLRLASAVSHRSAQQLVTEALDALLEKTPEVEALVRQLPLRDGRSGEKP